MTILAREGYHRPGMSIFLLFLRRLWIALDANSFVFANDIGLKCI